ncbi:STAS domain-containing protein [Allosediminivita pacifica]|uniref:RsbT antagonist protein RsbS n=1 Tax=Allosediminivita pacifica TaxID=1267769 RepID=A0A2T6AQ43_9RHOB|nr:STAS domain-containing protein [Allosediminivita pacifica]PTX45856.1 rsbT antagonist protein RsbS [Allosediminivita pacifica]GGB19640.1 anti-sigma factor antagonist [Allosediminivita pacifica]
MSQSAGLYLVDEIMLVAIDEDINDSDIVDLQDRLAQRVHDTGARGIVIDVSALEIVDTFVGRIIAQLAGIGTLLDSPTYLVGMRPAVAMTLVELGMTLPTVRTARNLQHALERLRATQ